MREYSDERIMEDIKVLLRLRRASYETLSRDMSLVRERYLLQPETKLQPAKGESHAEYAERKQRELALLDAQMSKSEEVMALFNALVQKEEAKKKDSAPRLHLSPLYGG